MLLPKREYIKDKAFLRWISEQACMACKIEMSSQAAHLHRYGEKSKSKKVSDSQARPLCHEGANNCHYKVDRYIIWNSGEREEAIDLPIYALWKEGKTEEAGRLMREF
jgi:hypothetical protein